MWLTHTKWGRRTPRGAHAHRVGPAHIAGRVRGPATVCVGCHDTPPAIDHMQTNGASIWEVRSTALNKPQKESCLICHGSNRLANIALVHTDRTP